MSRPRDEVGNPATKVEDLPVPPQTPPQSPQQLPPPQRPTNAERDDPFLKPKPPQ
jgi:hypothetical protein